MVCVSAQHDNFSNRILYLIVKHSGAKTSILIKLCKYGSIRWLRYIHGLGGYGWDKSACDAMLLVGVVIYHV